MNAMLRRFATFVILPLLAASLVVSVSRADELKDGRVALAAGHLDDAAQLFERAAEQGYAEGRTGLGEVWLRRRNYEKALEQFEMAQRMDANLAKAWWGVGEVARRNEDWATALPNFQRAIELDRKFPDAALALGDCLTKLRRFDEAVTALNPGLNWGPRWRPLFLVQLGFVELERDSLRDAGIYFTQAREAAPELPATSRALGEFYLKRGIGALAIPEFEKALSLDSTDIDLRFALGKALAFDQRYSEAIAQYQWVADQNPDYPGAQYELGSIYYRAGQAQPGYYAEALPRLEKYTSLVPNDPRGWSLLGRDLFYLGRKDEAFAAMTKAEELGDRSKDFYTHKFRLHVERKEWPQAMTAIEKGEPNTADLLKMAQVHVFMGNPAKADSVYRNLIERDSTSRDGRFAMLEMAKAQFRAKDYPTAISTLTRRIALDEKSDDAYYFRGLSYRELKQFPEALADLRQAANLAPLKSDRRFYLAVTLTQVDSLDSGIAEFRTMVAVDSTSKNASVAYQQIGFRDHLLKKDWAGAVDPLKRSVAIDPRNWQSMLWLAQAQQNSGDRGAAAENYRRVLELMPGQPDAQKGLKSLGL
jgi:tetratricopeptide (TPR) repeat protein